VTAWTVSDGPRGIPNEELFQLTQGALGNLTALNLRNHSLFLLVASFLWVLSVPTPARAAAPIAATAAATSITTSTAALNGVGTPNGELTTGWFRISVTNPGTCNDTFGTRIPTTEGTDLGAGSVAIPYSISATGLTLLRRHSLGDRVDSARRR
jgi:hypothetical protein